MTVKFRRNPESSTYKYTYEVMTCILQVLVLEMTTSRWEKAAWRVPVLFLLLALFNGLTWAGHHYYYGTKDWTLNGTSDDIIEASKLGLIKCFCCIFRYILFWLYIRWKYWTHCQWRLKVDISCLILFIIIILAMPCMNSTTQEIKQNNIETKLNAEQLTTFLLPPLLSNLSVHVLITHSKHRTSHQRCVGCCAPNEDAQPSPTLRRPVASVHYTPTTHTSSARRILRFSWEVWTF